MYKHLMTGVSFMIPAVAAGGILRISFIWGLIQPLKTVPAQCILQAALNAIGGGDGALGLRAGIGSWYFPPLLIVPVLRQV